MTYDPYSGEPVPVDYGRQTQTPTVEVEPAGEPAAPTKSYGVRRRLAYCVGILVAGVFAIGFSEVFDGADDEPPRRPTFELDEPDFVKADPVPVVGPTWSDNEKSYTMRVHKWPFAFRTGADWNCFGGSHEKFPGEQIEVCSGDKGQELALMLRDCPGSCTPKHRQKMVRQTFELDKPARKFDDSTMWAQSGGETYRVELSRIVDIDGQLQQLYVAAESPRETRDVVLKGFNDVVSQTQRMRG